LRLDQRENIFLFIYAEERHPPHHVVRFPAVGTRESVTINARGIDRRCVAILETWRLARRALTILEVYAHHDARGSDVTQWRPGFHPWTAAHDHSI
jgi:hypothetical protein